MKFLDTKEDFEWLQEVHKISTRGFVVAVLHGNEDCPSKIELYEENDMECKPTVYIYNSDHQCYYEQE